MDYNKLEELKIEIIAIPVLVNTIWGLPRFSEVS
jgi:hypothetical protein